MDYEVHTNGSISMEVALTPPYKLLFQATELRRERTGLHACISLLLATQTTPVLIDYDTYNMKRREDKQRLAYAAHKTLEQLDKRWQFGLMDKDNLNQMLGAFCWNLDQQMQKLHQVEDTVGDPDIPLEFLLTPFLLRNCGTILFAPPGRGKSFVGQIISQTLYYALDSFWPVRRTEVLYVNLERAPWLMRRRLGQINIALGLPPKSTLPMIQAKGRTLMAVMPTIRQAVKEREIGLVIVDSLSRAGFGNLNDNEVANTAMDSLNDSCPSWFCLAHTARKDESHTFGSQMYDAAADVTVSLHTQEKRTERGYNLLGLGLQVDKRNDLPKSPMIILALEFGQSGLTGIRKARDGEFLDIETLEKKDLREMVLEYLLDVGKASATDIAEGIDKPSSRSNIATLLKRDDAFVLIGQEGRKVLYGVKSTFR